MDNANRLPKNFNILINCRPSLVGPKEGWERDKPFPLIGA